MKITTPTALAGAFILSSILSSCQNDADPGPMQSAEKDYAILDFDRIELGDAFVITVQQGPVYSVHVQGDGRNLDDLEVTKVGTTLRAQYRTSRNRDYSTNFTITLPVLAGANFSGASNTTVEGFKGVDAMELILSGASISQLNVEAKVVTLNLSGASKFSLSGKSGSVVAKVSGASEMYGYSLEAGDADVEASGASKINVYVQKSLKVAASGASVVYYRGNPTVNASVSGASTVRAD